MFSDQKLSDTAGWGGNDETPRTATYMYRS